MRTVTVEELPPAPVDNIGWPWTLTTQKQIAVPALDTNPPRVSVVTPSYNQVEFIEETIRSVLLQGYPNLEYIVIDGGSTDGTLEILKKYQRWLTYWVSEPDHGQSDALNKGFERATGDLFAWQNSDDIYLPNAIGRMVKELLDFPNADVVFGNVRMTDRAGGLLREQKYTRFSKWCLLFEGLNVSNQSAIWRRAAHQRAGHFDLKLDYEMDLDFFLRLSEIARFRHVRETLGCMRLYEEAKTQHSFFPDIEREGAAIRRRYLNALTNRRLVRRLLRLVCLARRATLYAAQGDIDYVLSGLGRRAVKH